MSLTKEEPWDIKILKLASGEIYNNGPIRDDWITVQIFNDSYMNIYEGESTRDSEWCVEEIPIDGAKRLRDFLIYALKDK